MIAPEFPDETPLIASYRPLIDHHTSLFDPYSDMQFGSLWAWDVDGSTRISLLDGNLVLRLKDYVSCDHFFLLVGERRIARCAQLLIDHAHRYGLATELRLVPETVVSAERNWPASLRVVEDRSHFDYLLSNKEWATLDGPGYAAHRTKLNRFRRDLDVEERPVDLCCPHNRRAILALFDRWAAGKPDEAIDCRLERSALSRLFAPAIAPHVAGLSLFDAGKMIGFSLWEPLPNSGCSLHHFMKTDRAYPGISSYLLHRRAVHLALAGIPIANIEQDLGIPGLAEYKQSLRPVRLLRKYRIGPA